ncbi:MAG TPA: SpoIIE family protein phosphatase [Mycobacteriales bacterium]
MSLADDLQALLTGETEPYVVLGPEQVVVAVSDAFAAALGLAPDELRGRMLLDALPSEAEDRTDVSALLRARVAEADLRRQAQKLTAALYAEEVAGRRVRSLAQVALALTTASTIDALPSIIAQGLDVLDTDGGGLIVPGPGGGWLVVATAGGVADHGGEELPYDSPLPAPYVGRTGQPLLLLDAAAAAAFDPEVMRELSERTGREAWACLPITAGTEVLGVLTVSWERPRSLSLEELALLDGFAAQLATSLQRIRATEEQRAQAERALRLSETLQRSLLTTPAEHELLDIAVRYLPAAEEAQVGGDWYDVFATRTGRTLLVIGDVSGHDRTAAAMMGQVRNLLRGLAFDSDDGPAALLSRLDAALLGLDLETLATCVVVTVEPVGGACRIRWSNAGHLAPLLRLPDASITSLSDHHDLLLGLDPATERHEGVLDLAADSVLLLCTDGLVERRSASLEDGLARLAAALGSGPSHDPEKLCEHVLAALDDGRGEDDIALLVARVGMC